MAVARQLLAVPATSIASERLFSKAGDEITKKSNRLESSKPTKLFFSARICPLRPKLPNCADIACDRLMCVTLSLN